jgi:adenylate kinase
MRLIFLGAPGSGKSTQAKKLTQEMGIPQITTGDLLREAVVRDNALGKQAGAYMEKGDLVPDDVILPLVEHKTGEPVCAEGYVLDGFPRTLPQAMGFEEILTMQGHELDGVIFIAVEVDCILRRLSRRRMCTSCGTLYNLDANPPRVGDKCDKCGVSLVLRNDDAEETVRNRLRVYRRDTFPLVEYYEAEGLLRQIDGSGDIDAVFARILDQVSELRR